MAETAIEENGRIATQEITKAQTRVSFMFPGPLINPLKKSYETYRRIREHPTVALARAFVVAPVIAGEWSIEADDDVDPEIIKFVEDEMFPIREKLLTQAMFGGVDFGWQGFELVYELREDGLIHLKKAKPLLHDITQILVTGQTGAFAGFKNGLGLPVVVPIENSLLFTFREEGTQWYGRSLLENIRLTFNSWTAANDGAARYDKKLAGAHLICHFEPGDSIWDGVLTENQTIAQNIITLMVASGGVVMPNDTREFEDGDKTNTKFRLGVLDTKSKQATFSPRLEYLDKHLVRGLEFPERAALEGNFGTKADAQTHGDLALTNMDLRHRDLTRTINWHVVNRLLVLNYGREAENTVRLVAAPLSNAKIEAVRAVYDTVIGTPEGIADQLETIDLDGVKDMIGLPSLTEEQQAERREPDDVDLLDEVLVGVGDDG